MNGQKETCNFTRKFPFSLLTVSNTSRFSRSRVIISKIAHDSRRWQSLTVHLLTSFSASAEFRKFGDLCPDYALGRPTSQLGKSGTEHPHSGREHSAAGRLRQCPPPSAPFSSDSAGTASLDRATRLQNGPRMPSLGVNPALSGSDLIPPCDWGGMRLIATTER